MDELASLLRPVRVTLARRSAEIVLGLAVLITVLVGFAIAGAAVDDRAITANPATAQAEVLDGSSFTRTLVRFTVANGEVRVPERGVFYPRGLQPGSMIPVEYDVTDPDLVRVASNPAAYRYLGESIRAWPAQPELAARIAAAGWREVAWRDLTFGAVALHRAVRG